MSGIAAASGAAATASDLFAGATPFGWAKLGVDLLTKAGGQPAGPSNAMGSIGGNSMSFGFDNSGWTVATSGSTANATSGTRYGPASGAGGSAYPSAGYEYGTPYQGAQMPLMYGASGEGISQSTLLIVAAILGVAMIMKKG